MRFPGPLLMCFPLVSLGIAIAWLQGRRAQPEAFPPAPGSFETDALPTWATAAEEAQGDPCTPTVRLVPLHRDPRQQEFETNVLRSRLGLESGEPWSLQLSLPGACDAGMDLARIELRGPAGSLVPLDASSPSETSGLHDPVQVLFDRPAALAPGATTRFVVWGPQPQDSLELLGVGARVPLILRDLPDTSGAPFSQSNEREGSSTANTNSALGWAAEKAKLEQEISRLRGELENALEDRVAREAELVAWAEMLTGIVPQGAPPELYALLGASPPLEEPPPEVPVDPVLELREKRSKEVFLGLRALMVIERLDSLDLLESGMVELGHTGPVVFRQLDERGRPVGTLSADRLRLEGSRIARTLTIVLEDGYERLSGQKIPFEGTQPGEERGGTRRIFLQNTDPRPWFESAPELFEEESLEVLQDDGTWRIFLVHRKLNELLGLDAALGHYRIVQIAGILDDELRGVELEQLDRDGRLTKRLFADRLTIHREPKGMLLLLQDGVQTQSGNKLPFLEGRYRIFLPKADQIQWTAAGLPGLTDAKESPLGTQGQ